MQPTFTPREFRQAQDTLGLSDAELAQVLGCQPVQIRRMKVADVTLPSHRPVSPATARLLKAYLDGYRPADWPA